MVLKGPVWKTLNNLMIKVQTKPGMEDSEDQVTVLFIYSHNAQRHCLMMFFKVILSFIIFLL